MRAIFQSIFTMQIHGSIVFKMSHVIAYNFIKYQTIQLLVNENSNRSYCDGLNTTFIEHIVFIISHV